MTWKQEVYDYGLKHKCRIRSVFANVPPVEGKRCLDLGCGNGVFTWLLQARGACAFGVDLDISMARLAAADTPVAVGDAVKLPFRSESFDFVFALETTYYFDETKARSEIHRVLKPGGILVLSVLHDQPTLDTRRICRWLQAYYVKAQRDCYNEAIIAASYPGFTLLRSDSFSIFFIEVLQSVLYRLRQGRSVQPESIATHNPAHYSGVWLYELVYPALSVFFLLDAILKRLGASGHNKIYVLSRH